MRWENGESNTFYTKDLEPVVEMKIGDRVKVLRAWKEGESRGKNSFVEDMKKYIGEVGTIEEVTTNDYCLVRFADGGLWYFADIVLQKADTKPHTARILTEKVMVGDVKCRKITGFEGILTEEELPERYLAHGYRDGALWFAFKRTAINHTQIFDGSKMVSGPYTKETDGHLLFYPGHKDLYFDKLLFVGDIIPETTFQNILIWLKRAGSRLAKIKRQEQDAWTGQEEVSI